MRKLYIVSFTVEGFGSFPTDMLRYDGCHPQGESEANRITRSHSQEDNDTRERWQVRVSSRGRERHWEPCDGRWRSFNWRVVPDSIEHHEQA